jgi:tungstate transport system ATP-binding protein
MALLQVSHLGQEYDGQHILSDVNLTVGKSEVFALIGPTGAGKTTLLRLLDLLDVPSSGEIFFDGIDVTRSGRRRLEARRRMAYVQQKPIVFRTDVYANVACGLKWRHQKKEVIRRRVDGALDLVGMAGYKKRDARTLSGGEMQRIAIARALVTEPELLLLDEPTANLDPVSVSKIEEVLAHVIADRRITVLMATHDMPQGQRLANRIGVLANGELLQVGTPNEIFCSPSSRTIAELVGVENILAGVVREKDQELTIINIDGHDIQAVSGFGVGDKVHALIRPEDITLTLSKDPSSARNVFGGKMSRMSLLGPLVRIEIDCGFPLLVTLTAISLEEMGLTIGSQVYASFKATGVHVIKRQD